MRRTWTTGIGSLMAIVMTACGGGGGDDAPPNLGPTAVAGLDQVVDEQVQVTLNGSASTDPDGTVARYGWTQIAGTPVTLGTTNTAITEFEAPALSSAVTLTFQLSVTDDRNATATDTVNVTVNPVQGLNQPPSADPGPDRSARSLGRVLLDGTASTDSDGTVVSFHWQEVSSTGVSIANANTARASFTAPAAPAELEFELIVMDNEGSANASRVTITVVPATILTLSGTVTFDLVPASISFSRAYLNYAATQVVPARGITVEFIDAVDGMTVLANGRTGADGTYTLAVPNLADGFVRARAELVQAGTPGWNFRVVDNTNGDALYVVDGTSFNTGTADASRDLHAASGWNGVSYSAPRSAAPLAILDLVYDAAQLVLGAAPNTVFPALDVHWSTQNRNAFGANGQPDPNTGELGTSFYRSGPGGGIFLLGSANSDTEEYDRHVIAHEWGHYLEAQFSRSDSIGGPHTIGDQLDLRTAFGEGWGNAFSAMATGDPVYKDTLGPQQAQGFEFDVESDSREHAGWYNEFSVQEILYDIYDADADTYLVTPPVQDNVSLGFGPIFDVLTGAQRTTVAVTSLFPFINALKSQNLAAAAGVDDLLRVHEIEPILLGDDYGGTENNAGTPGSTDVLPVYVPITVNGDLVNVCSTDEFSSSTTGSTNKLGSRRLLRFQTSVAGAHTVTARTTSAPPNKFTDPDLVLHRAGRVAYSFAEPSDACMEPNIGECTETLLSPPLVSNAEYVLEVYEWTNTNDSEDPEFPPIGRVCFDVEVTR